MNTSAAHTDYAAMGLAHYRPGQSAFEAVPPKGIERACTAPKKTGPKPTKAQTKTMTAKGRELAEQRLALDKRGRATVDMKPRTTGAITIHSKADTDRVARLGHGRVI